MDEQCSSIVFFGLGSWVLDRLHPAALDKRLKERTPARVGRGLERLGMALDANHKVAVQALDCLDNPIRRPADRAQAGGDRLKRLVVERVGLKAGRPKQ